MLRYLGPLLLLHIIEATAQSGIVTFSGTTVLVTTGTGIESSNTSLTTPFWTNSTTAVPTPTNETSTFFFNSTITTTTTNSSFISSTIISSLSSTLNSSILSGDASSTFGSSTGEGSSTGPSTSDTGTISSSSVTSDVSSISTFSSSDSTVVTSNSSASTNATSLLPPPPSTGSDTLTIVSPTPTAGDTSTSDSGQTPTIIPPTGQTTNSDLPPSPTTSYSDEEIEFYLSMTTWDWNLVTSTLTSDPTISGTSTSNSEWKKNFWLKTEIDGKPTDLPVVHCGCICKNNCDSDKRDDDEAAFWIIFFNVPKVPNIQISLPKLPDFHLGGCMKIKIPIINIEIPLGKCPPVSDNGKNGHKDPDDPKDNNREPDDSPDPEPSNGPSSGEESTKSSTTSSSSSSSCSGAVVTDFLTRISCPSSGATGTQCATAVETDTRSGCSLTGTASVTETFSAPACMRQSWPTSWPAGTGYTAPGSSYGAYTPPDWGSETTIFSSMSANESATQSETATGPPPTTLSTITTIVSANTSSIESEITTPISGTGNATTVDGTPTATDTPATTNATETSTEATSSTPDGTSTPTPSPGLECENQYNEYFVNQDVMRDGINTFCDEASNATAWDDGTGRIDNHKRIERLYNNDTADQIVLIVSSMSDETDQWTPVIDRDDCISNLTVIFDQCPPTQDIPGLDWRHGGEYTNGALDWLILTDRRKYNPGICTFQVNEKSQDNQWSTQTGIKDSDDDEVVPLGDYDPISEGEINDVPGLYATLKISGESDSLGFTLGNYGFDQTWNTGTEDVPRCNVDEWHSLDDGTSALGRTTNCWVYC